MLLSALVESIKLGWRGRCCACDDLLEEITAMSDDRKGYLGSVTERNWGEQNRERLKGRTIVLVANRDVFVVTHRLTWARAFKAAGADVVVLANDTGYASTIRDSGIRFISTPLGREDLSVSKLIVAASILLHQLVQLRPTDVFLVATVAYSLGWPIALVRPSCRVVRVVAGAGRAIGTDKVSRLKSTFVRMQLKLPARLRNVSTLFQTESDRRAFVDMRLACDRRSHIIPGTGIDTEYWRRIPVESMEDRPIRVLFASRLFAEKGVYEFAQVAEDLHENEDLEFWLAGEVDDGVSSAIPLKQIEQWEAKGYLKWLGRVEDMRTLLSMVDILVFPSNHPEGTPRVLIEAAACGVPVVCSDIPGCRAVLGENACYVDPADQRKLSQTIFDLAVDANRRRILSTAARQRIEDSYSLEKVLDELLDEVL